MRRIVTFNWLSADGYFAAADGNLDWVVTDDEQTKAAVRMLPSIDTLLFGRRTYEIFARFWPNAVDDSGAATDPHRPGRHSKEHRALAEAFNAMTKLVFSRTLENATWRNTRIVREFDAREIEAMKARDGKDVLVCGSGTIASLLTEHGLIDEYQFAVCPVVLGGGRTWLTGVARTTKLRLVEAKSLPSGDVLVSYAH